MGKGQQDYFYNEAAVEANIKSKLLSWTGNCAWDLPAGIDWLNRLGNPGQQQALVVEIKQLVLQCYGVVSILAFNANFVTSTRIGAITMTLQTIFSPSANITITVPQVGVSGNGS